MFDVWPCFRSACAKGTWSQDTKSAVINVVLAIALNVSIGSYVCCVNVSSAWLSFDVARLFHYELSGGWWRGQVIWNLVRRVR